MSLMEKISNETYVTKLMYVLVNDVLVAQYMYVLCMKLQCIFTLAQREAPVTTIITTSEKS